ncbi:related to folC [Rhynchosporium secalis]|uniref:Folylpolyglutamate synthase n=1 Tax=Rhynchosporium secalis TaxID=38038 RepID=A0A1E1LWI9_RHYSE|nr:related to folC [Rhynchosporium secalis]
MASLLLLPSSIRNVSIFAWRTPSLLKLRSLSTAINVSEQRSYAEAIKLLNSLQSNRAIVSSISTTPADMNRNAIPEMLEWTRKAGYQPNDLIAPGLKYIHVAGTKGKGSVSVMIENILLQYWRKSNHRTLGRIGLYTSPHLIHVRERIRIDGSPISEALFAQYFYELWDRLSLAADRSDMELMPNYFRFLTILAFHTFIREDAGTAIVECGIGGEYDSTNILPPEAVTTCAITSLGIDHEAMLGETIEEIAWHKGGIMKPGVPAFSVKQLPSALAVLEKRASDKEVDLIVVERLPILEDVRLVLEGDFQKDNASLAVEVVASHLKTLGVADVSTSTVFPEEFKSGLETVTWPGRCQYIIDGNTEWMIDGAHTLESISATAIWFREKCVAASTSPHPPTATMLIFNQQSERDSESLLAQLLTEILTLQQGANQEELLGDRAKDNFSSRSPRRAFTYAAFCTNRPFTVEQDSTEEVDLTLQNHMARKYMRLDRGNPCHMVYGSAEEAVDLAYKVSEGEERVLVLVTGSLHLAGAVLQVLEEKRGKDVDVSGGET